MNSKKLRENNIAIYKIKEYMYERLYESKEKR